MQSVDEKIHCRTKLDAPGATLQRKYKNKQNINYELVKVIMNFHIILLFFEMYPCFYLNGLIYPFLKKKKKISKTHGTQIFKLYV